MDQKRLIIKLQQTKEKNAYSTMVTIKANIIYIQHRDKCNFTVRYLQWCAFSRQGSKAHNITEVDGDWVKSLSLYSLPPLQLLCYWAAWKHWDFYTQGYHSTTAYKTSHPHTYTHCVHRLNWHLGPTVLLMDAKYEDTYFTLRHSQDKGQGVLNCWYFSIFNWTQ